MNSEAKDYLNFEAKHYTIECICILHEALKEEFEESFISLDTDYDNDELKHQFALFDLIGTMVLKFRIQLLKKKEYQIIKVKLKPYQGYFLSQFLFENKGKFAGIAEQTFLETFATKIAQKL